MCLLLLFHKENHCLWHSNVKAINNFTQFKHDFQYSIDAVVCFARNSINLCRLGGVWQQFFTLNSTNFVDWQTLEINHGACWICMLFSVFLFGIYSSKLFILETLSRHEMGKLKMVQIQESIFMNQFQLINWNYGKFGDKKCTKKKVASMTWPFNL